MSMNKKEEKTAFIEYQQAYLAYLRTKKSANTTTQPEITEDYLEELQAKYLLEAMSEFIKNKNLRLADKLTNPDAENFSEDSRVRESKETISMIPEYILQNHAISRSAHSLSTIAKKILMVCIASLPHDLSTLSTTISLYHLYQALGLDPGGTEYETVKKAINEIMKNVIHIEYEQGWEKYNWTSYAKYDKKTNLITIKLSQDISKYILEIKKLYCKIDLKDIGKLTGQYAIRYLEIIKSKESEAGQHGNEKDCWYWEIDIPKLRFIMGIKDNEYQLTNNLKIWVIEKPIAELNNANLGIQVKIEYIRKGKYLVGVRFLCGKTNRTLKSRKKDSEVLPAPRKSPIEDHSLKEKELNRIKNSYPDEYYDLYSELLKNPPNDFMKDMSELWATQASTIVCQKLIEKHGIRK